jgi:hypothetical protein
MNWSVQIVLAVIGYLFGMAFAGSFLGRKWMGVVDIFLHKLFKRKITLGKYLYWRHFCNISNPPKPENLAKPRGLGNLLLARLFSS